MNKPLNLMIEDVKEELVQAINNTNLPPFLLEPIVKDIYNEIVILKQNDLVKSKTEYDKSLDKETQSKDTETEKKKE